MLDVKGTHLLANVPAQQDSIHKTRHGSQHTRRTEWVRSGQDAWQ